MARRTGLDTLFDNQSQPDIVDEAIGAEFDAAMTEIDIEDENQLVEGNPGDEGAADEMSDEDYQAAISSGIEAAENYVDTELSPDREEAARYYRGERFGNEVEGRSQVVMTEVRDTVLSVMPALLRVFCGSTDAVEFINSEATPVEQADHQTAYVNHIIHKDNDGFMIFYSAFKDALLRRTGIFTWWHEEKEVVEREVLTGLDENAYAMLLLEKEESSSESEHVEYDVEVLDERPDTTAPEESPDLLAQGGMGDPLDPMSQPEPAPQSFIRDVVVLRRTLRKRHRVDAVPPEEFICTPIASSDIDIFPLVGRRQWKTIGELVAIGHDEEKIREAIGGTGGSPSDALSTNGERLDRDGGAVADRLFDPGFSDVDEASEWVKYCEVYVLIDKDGDGIIERRKICTVGSSNEIIYDEITDEMVPFATICPDPEGHSPFGYSLADQTMDMQEIQSEMMRGVLDSLAESIFGRTAIVEGQVNIDDALSNARDQLIRTKSLNAIQTLSNPFNGQNAIPVMDYLNNVKARRTGMTMAPSGLKADVLQSTSTDAVNAVVETSQERAEMIARIFAETGVKRLFRGLLKQVVRHQDQKRTIRLRGKPTSVDPRTFNVELDLDTNVGLGRGNGAKRIGALQMILGQQKEVYQAYGPTNPIVTLFHISNTVEDLVREVGFNDVSRYMKPITADEADKLRQQAEQAPKTPTPEELLYKAQSERTQADLVKVQEQEKTKRLLGAANEDMTRDRDDQNFYLKAAELMGKFGIQTNEQEMRARMEADRSADTLATQATQGAEQSIQPPSNANGNK